MVIEIKEQAVGTQVKMKASHRTQWMNECRSSTMKIQMSPLEDCEKLLQGMDKNKPLSCNKDMVNLFKYIDIKCQLDINDLGKKTYS
ncbi:hypothetical protein TNCV_3987861 [Trichonephila clavipes]|nr:hypothetical protein TNCV_3987861 [Trichonephila clavipes]